MILDEIIAHKKEELAQKKRRQTADRLDEICSCMDPPRSLPRALRQPGVQIIAEMKRCSPSAGVIREHFEPKPIAASYQAGGAAAVSVLTDARYFGGDDRHVADARLACDLPVLRKEFIVDEWQVYESRALAADAVLLLVRALSDEQLDDYLWTAKDLGMAALVEAHDEWDIERAVAVGASVIGINNRDLSTFEVDLHTTLKLRPLVPEGVVVVSESGIETRGDLMRLAEAGVDAALIGTALMAAEDIESKLREFVGVEAVA
ncbi:MAG: indole-3-glycerol phosphate synthase TrpC [Armatimonadota bacterium]